MRATQTNAVYESVHLFSGAGSIFRPIVARFLEKSVARSTDITRDGERAIVRLRLLSPSVGDIVGLFLSFARRLDTESPNCRSAGRQVDHREARWMMHRSASDAGY